MKSAIIFFVFLLFVSLNKQSEARVIVRDLHLNPQDDLQSLVIELGGKVWFNIGKKGEVISLRVFNVALEPDYNFGSINSPIITGTLILENSPETVEVKLLLSRENVGFGSRTLEDPFRIVVDLYPEGSATTQVRRNNKDRRVENSDLGKVSQVQQGKKVATRKSVNSAGTSRHAELKKVSAVDKGQEKMVFSARFTEKKGIVNFV